MLVPVLGPLAAISVLGCALGGADPALEGVTPKQWARWRAAELAGLGGLAAIGVVSLGPRLAWIVPSAAVFAGAGVGARDEAWLEPVIWPVQEGGTGGVSSPSHAASWKPVERGSSGSSPEAQ
jgi:hypothetical protein